MMTDGHFGIIVYQQKWMESMIYQLEIVSSCWTNIFFSLALHSRWRM